MSSTYTTRTHTRGMVLYMLEGLVVCTKGAMIHKVAIRRCGREAGMRCYAQALGVVDVRSLSVELL
jgi:hypothetical protein